MNKKLTRRGFIKKTLGALLAIGGLGSGGYVYAHNIEPALVDLQSIIIKHPLIPKSFNGITIAQFSDTHLGFHYQLNQLKKLVIKINNLKPDIVLFTGDLIDDPKTYRDSREIIPVLRKIHAPLGKYSIYGNHDHGGYGTNLYKQIMEDGQFTLLRNSFSQVELSDGSKIYLIGIDDAMLGRPDFITAQKDIPNQGFKILLSHAPDLADQASLFNIHWQLSGHSHGGQVKLPFIGPLIIPPFARNYREGHYIISDKLNLYVNRGLGTTRLPFRFLARPELTIFTLHSSPPSADDVHI
jgi:predicted MPP superfamily phosphohydrolase